MKCPICNNIYNHSCITKENRDKKIRQIAKTMKGKQKKLIIAKIIELLHQHESDISERHIHRILRTLK